MKFTFALAILAFVISSCSYTDVVFESVDGVHLKSMNKSAITIEVNASIDNPNSYPIKIKDANIEVFVNDNLIGTIEEDDVIKIKSKSKDSHSFLVTTSIDKIVAGGFLNIPAFASGKPIEISGKGTITAKGLLVKKTFKVDFKDTISLEDLR